jgi:hypothetical protein
MSGKRGPNGGVIDIDDPVERLLPCRLCGQPVSERFPGRRMFDVGHHTDGICIAALGAAVRELQDAAAAAQEAGPDEAMTAEDADQVLAVISDMRGEHPYTVPAHLACQEAEARRVLGERR